MNSQKIVFKETGIVALGELICSAVMVAVFAALGFYEARVLWSTLAGSLIMTVNFFFMAVTASNATDRAAQGDVKQAQKSVQLSSSVRLLLVAVAIIVGVKLGGNVIALTLPLTFVRPILMLAEFFRKKGD